MFGKTVILEDEKKGIKIEVFVCCTSDTSEEELKRRAIEKLMSYIIGIGGLQ